MAVKSFFLQLCFLICLSRQCNNSEPAVSATHFCECVQSPSPLSNCLHVQAFYQNIDRIRVIESDLLLDFDQDRLDLLQLNWIMYSKKTTSPGPRPGHPWLHYFNNTLELSKMGKLKQYHFYPKAKVRLPNGTESTSVDAFEHFLMEKGDMILKDQEKVDLENPNAFYLPNKKKPFASITSNANSDGYLLLDIEGIRFYDLENWLMNWNISGQDAIQPYQLITTADPQRAEFVSCKAGCKASNGLFTSMPIGIVLKGKVFLMDIKAEQVIIFKHVGLKDGSPKTVSFKKLPIREFVRCQYPYSSTSKSPTDAKSWYYMVLGVMIITIIISMAFLWLIYSRNRRYDLKNVAARIEGASKRKTNHQRMYKYQEINPTHGMSRQIDNSLDTSSSEEPSGTSRKKKAKKGLC